MSWTAILFYVFSTILLFSAFRVITARNSVHAALYLMLTFFQAALIWMLLKAEFLSIVLVLVYLGAVMVLFLFVVMMLDIHADGLRLQFWKNLPAAAVLGALMAGEMALVLLGDFGGVSSASTPVVNENNTLSLGRVLYVDYIYPVQIAGVLLLLAIVAAIALTLRERKDSKKISVADQVRVRAKDRLRVVSVQSVKPAADNRSDEGAL